MSAYIGEGGTDLIDIMGGGLPDTNAIQWLSEKAGMVQHGLSNMGHAFMEKARNLYNVVSETQTMQLLRNLRQQRKDVWASNQIQFLRNLEQLQTANPYMQRWIMAEPDTRTRYLKQALDGYSGSYINLHGDRVGEDHFDYRQVMDGVVQVSDVADRDFVIRYFNDPLTDAEKPLSTTEKIDILNTWDLVKHYLDEGGEDPTSKYGMQL